MKKILPAICIAMIAATTCFSQDAVSKFSDSLVPDKMETFRKFLPFSGPTVLYSVYLLSPDEFFEKIESFRHTEYGKIDEKTDDSLRGLRKKDVDYLISTYVINYENNYGIDSTRQAAYWKLAEEKRDSPNVGALMDSAFRSMYVKKLTDPQKQRIDSIVDSETDLNNWELFRRSQTYRIWLMNKVYTMMYSKYATDFFSGGHQEDIQAKILNNDINNPEMKEYFRFMFADNTIKTPGDTSLKDKVYNDFMAQSKDESNKKKIEEEYNNYKHYSANATAPGFSYSDVNKKQVTLKSLQGKYVLIDVWATWCGPCKGEIPFLTKLEDEFKGKNIHFVSLSVDKQADRKKWAAFVKERHLKGIQLITENAFQSDFVQKFNINSIPRFILIDPNGKIVSNNLERPSDPNLRERLNKLLNM